jgi:formylglycine-generating enzyme required for sulfatase activity
MKRTLVLSIAIFVSITSLVSAEVIRDGIDIDFVTIGNAGNAADTTGYGAVANEFRIGKYEVTNAQWNAFVSIAGVPTGNPIYAYNENGYWNGTNVPANEISWYEAAQFCNYLTSGDKSKGAYQFSGDNTNPGDFLGINRASSISTYGISYVIPTEDEWYKAAYYTGSGYSLYANGTNTVPSTSQACYNQSQLYAGPWDIGTGTMEQNGTFDMMGNVWEWNETLFEISARGFRGGCYYDGNMDLRSAYPQHVSPDLEGLLLGFRVASIPEPASLLLLALGGILAIRKK